jgi:hypothetical protein
MIDRNGLSLLPSEVFTTKSTKSEKNPRGAHD